MTIKSNPYTMGAIAINNGKTRSSAQMYTGTNERNSCYWDSRYRRYKNLHTEISAYIKRKL